VGERSKDKREEVKRREERRGGESWCDVT
jgi:hypothetical protein